MSSYFSLNRLSIQQRLTLLICTLLLSAIVIYGFASYYSFKKTILIIGKDRLTSLTKQIGNMLSQNTKSMIKAANATAAQNASIQYLQSGGKESRKETLEALGKLHRDSTWVSVEMLDRDFVPVLRAVNSTRSITASLKDVIASAKVGPDSTKVGKLYNLHGQMYYPIISTVTDKSGVIGYIISWVYLKGD